MDKKNIKVKNVCDTVSNATSGFGGSSDPLNLLSYSVMPPLDESTIRDLYRMNWAIRFATETIPFDALRPWIDINAENEDIVVWLNNKIGELEFKDKLEEALILSRLFGGSVIIVGAVDGKKDLTKPLDCDNIQEVSFLNVLDRTEITIEKTYKNAFSSNYGEPEIYKLNTRLQENRSQDELKIHESRVLRFDGAFLPNYMRISNEGWHDSELNSINESFQHYGLSLRAGAVLFQDFITKVLKIPNLADLLTDEDGQSKLEQRIQYAIGNMSSLGIVLTGDGEEFSKIQTPIGGLVQFIEKYIDVFSASTHIPKTRIFGQALGTLAGATETTRNYYDMLCSWREKKTRKQITKFLNIILRSKDSITRGKKPDNVSFKYNSLWLETDKEITTARKMQAQIDELYIKNNVLHPSEVGTNRFRPDGFSFDMNIDLSKRDPKIAKDLEDKIRNPVENNPFGDGNNISKDGDNAASNPEGNIKKK